MTPSSLEAHLALHSLRPSVQSHLALEPLGHSLPAPPNPTSQSSHSPSLLPALLQECWCPHVGLFTPMD